LCSDSETANTRHDLVVLGLVVFQPHLVDETKTTGANLASRARRLSDQVNDVVGRVCLRRCLRGIELSLDDAKLGRVLPHEVPRP